MTSNTPRPGTAPAWSIAAFSAIFSALGAHSALAQAIERNLPPPPVSTAPVIAPPNIVASTADPAPIGPALSGLVILGNSDPVNASAASGIDVSRTPRLEHDGGLRRFLGQPISRRLIAEIEAQIASTYRDQGYPFVSLSTPPQELTTGVLQIRVLEFRMGTKTVPGAREQDVPFIESRVRVAPGQEIGTVQLGQDLDWLDRYPYRSVTAVFTPGATPGQSDLQLQTTYAKPWTVYAGYSNSGSPLTSFDRYFAGFQTIVPGLRDAIVSYQFTGSDNALFNDQAPFSSAANPTYLSHAGRLIVPTLARQDVELSVDYVQTYEPVQDLFTRIDTVEANLAYRAALSDFAAALPGEGVIGIEAKSETSRAIFNNQNVAEHAINIYQGIIGWAYSGNDPWGRTLADATVHLSPGGLDSRNSVAAFKAFSNGRFVNDQYAYVSGDLTRFTRLPAVFGFKDLSLVNTLIGQYSAVPLPLSEQAGLGGPTLVRGYTLDDGAADTALVSRNELHGPILPIGLGGSAIAPYVFFDTAIGVNEATKKQEYPTSTGVAVDIQLGRHISASLDGAWALRNAGFTRTGNGMFDIKVTVSY